MACEDCVYFSPKCEDEGMGYCMYVPPPILFIICAALNAGPDESPNHTGYGAVVQNWPKVPTDFHCSEYRA